MMQRASFGTDVDGGGRLSVAAAPPTPLPPAIQPSSTRPAVPIVSQPTTKPVELPPQYRPRKPRKQVNVACQPCRKRRSKVNFSSMMSQHEYLVSHYKKLLIHFEQCTGTAPCARCVAEGNECIFDGRKDAQERNRELRNSEKALSKVFRVLKKLQADDSDSTAAISQLRKLAQKNADLPAFARELMDDKTDSDGLADQDAISESSCVKRENSSRSSTHWQNISPKSEETGSTVRYNICLSFAADLTD